MPFYDYKCENCGQVSEVRHGMSEKPTGMKCEVCGMGELKRVFQSVGWLGSSVRESSHSQAHSGGECSSCSSGACGSCAH